MITPGETRVPEVIDALVKIAGTLDGCLVLDGPTPRRMFEKGKATIAIGVGSPAVTSTMQRMEGFEVKYLEVSDIVCNIASWSGGTKWKPHRDRCKELLAQFDAKIREDSTLGGLVDLVCFGADFAWAPEVDKNGASAVVGFSIEVTATL